MKSLEIAVKPLRMLKLRETSTKNNLNYFFKRSLQKILTFLSNQISSKSNANIASKPKIYSANLLRYMIIFGIQLKRFISFFVWKNINLNLC